MNKERRSASNGVSTSLELNDSEPLSSPNDTGRVSDYAASSEESFGREIFRLKAERFQLQNSAEQEQSNYVSLVKKYADLKSHYTRLTKFYVVVERLLAQASCGKLFLAIQDIVANLIGCEEIGIFLLDQENLNLSLVSSLGLNDAKLASIPVKGSLLGSTLLNGELYLASNPKHYLPQEEGINACIPLRANGRLFGVIAIFHLLPQKVELDANDRELLALLGRLAAAALLCLSADHLVARNQEKNANAGI